MPIPPALLDSLEGLPGFDREAFLHAHRHYPSIASIRFHPIKSPEPTRASRHISMAFAGTGDLLSTPVPWWPEAWSVAPRPFFTFDPAFHGGAYYVQEAASMFLGHALTSLCESSKELRAVDLCAAPGGKSTQLASLPFITCLLSNEIIRSRVPVLYENTVKWGMPHVFVSQDDPVRIGRMTESFDIMVVDAPCSGSGLFRRDPDAIKEWSPRHVGLCSQRQQRILADALPALAEDGILAYSTCSYSREENEDILDWLVEAMGMESLSVDSPADWGVHPTRSPRNGAAGYRFYPGEGAGEGFFLACLRKRTGGRRSSAASNRYWDWSNSPNPALPAWLDEPERYLYREHAEGWMAVPSTLSDSLDLFASHTSLRRSGLLLGRVIKGRLNPDHELAMTVSLRSELSGVELSRADALRYLRRENFRPDACEEGWNLMRFEGVPLGWLKAMGHRANNYYPMDWRIRSAGPRS